MFRSVVAVIAAVFVTLFGVLASGVAQASTVSALPTTGSVGGNALALVAFGLLAIATYVGVRVVMITRR